MNQISRTALVVDDSQTMRNFLAAALRRLSFQVFTAQDGHQALEILAFQPVDLICCDLYMPHMDGGQFVEQLKSNSVTRQVPVLLFSSNQQPNELLQPPILENSIYLTKPFSFLVFKEAVEQLLANGS